MGLFDRLFGRKTAGAASGKSAEATGGRTAGETSGKTAREAGAVASTLEGEPLPMVRRASVWIANPASAHVLKEVTI